MKILIIGAGAVAESSHIPAAIKLLGIDNVYLAESNKLQLDKIIFKYGLKNYDTNYQNLFNYIDAAIIATPPHTHNEIIKNLIIANKPILCEKPLSPDSIETKKIIKTNENGILIAMCHTYRFFQNRIKVRNLIKGGYFGDQVSIDIQEGFPSAWPTVSGYCFRKEMVLGGVVFDAGIHSLDFILWCLGEPTNIEYTDDQMGGLESNANIKLMFVNGEASFRISRTCELSNKIKVSGNGKTVELDIYEMNNLFEDGVVSIADQHKMLDWSTIGECQIRNFVDAIEQKTEISCDIEDGLRVIEILEKCYTLKQTKTTTPETLGNYSGKKILVTGATGFIGSLLAERLHIHEGANVRAMVHSWPKAAYISRFDVELLRADITIYEDVEKAVEGCDYVFHCVGLGGPNALKINADGTENLVKACKQHKVKRVVYLSSVVVHGDKITDGLTADAPLISYGDNYADAKIEAEKRFWKLTKELDIEGSVIRPSYVWGPMSEWFSVEIIKQMKADKFYWVNNGKGSCNAVYVENLIDLALICGEHTQAAGESFLITDDERDNWRNFFGYYAEMLHKNPNSFPSIPLKDGIVRKFLKFSKRGLNTSISKLWNKILTNELTHPFFSKWMLRAPRKVLKMILKQVLKRLPEKSESEMAIYNFQGFIDITKTKQFLDYKPRFSISQGMEETKKWLQTENYLK
jgi:nucleoside-diphosphate-sugar epimerase/predicted dehydrogenase